QNPQASGFSSKDIAVFAKRARELNAAGQGDQAVFYMRTQM
ncbi:MAG: class I SAM-dependent methyltransferase, partial [Ignavibacteria bacterium]